MIKAVLFDLDGTLLPMDQHTFVKAYLYLLSKKASEHGYEPNRLINTIWQGTEAMINNDGSKTNEEVFWDIFTKEYGDKINEDKAIFDSFYLNEFNKVKDSCGYNKKTKEVIEILKNKNVRIILATNPIFPKMATEARIKWAGLSPLDFDFYTTYENYSHSKPNLEYYKDIMAKLDCSGDECLMIGNDIEEDMIASKLGMKTFLLTDCLINKNNKDIDLYKNGNFDDLIKYLTQL